MFFTRKIGKLLRGKITPTQIILACLLGALVGGSPGWAQAPLWNLILFCAVLILNANLFLAGITYLLVKLISLLLLPLYFQVGTSLVEGPLNGLVSMVVNAPVAAWFGWEYYITLPSLLVASGIGLFLGFGLARTMSGFRAKMASLEENSEAYNRYTQSFWIKSLAWIFLGGLKGKKSWAELAENKKGLPIRPVGIIFVASLLIVGVIGLKMLESTIVTSSLRSQLENLNGATVDLQSVEVNAVDNQVKINGLAFADPSNLKQNRFASEAIVADMSGFELLRKKIVIDRLEAVNATSSTERKVPGIIVGKPPEEDSKPFENPDLIDIFDYIEKGKEWRDRLASVKRIYDKVSPYIPSKDAETDTEEEMTWRERLAAEAKASGYANVKSASVIRKSPQLLVRKILAKDIEVGGDDLKYDLVGNNISTQPQLLEGERGSLTLKRSDNSMSFIIALPSQELPNTTGIEVEAKDLKVDDLQKEAGGKLPLQGGKLNLKGLGELVSGRLQLPMNVTLVNTTVTAFGQSAKVGNLPLEVEVAGTLTRPSLSIPSDALQSALKGAVVDGIKQKGQEMIEEKAKEKITEKAGEQLKKFLPFGD